MTCNAVPDSQVLRKCIFTPVGNSIVMAVSQEHSPTNPLGKAEDVEQKLTGANSVAEE